MLKKPSFFTPFSGHYGIFELKDDMLDSEDREMSKIVNRVMSVGQENNETCTIRMAGIRLPPAAFVNFNSSHFEIFGYSYSVLVEAARFLNCSVEGHAVNTAHAVPSSDLPYLLAKMMPHFILPTVSPNNYYFYKVVMKDYNPLEAFGIEKVAYASEMVWVSELDHVLGCRRFATHGLSDIVDISDEVTRILSIVFAIMLPVISWFVYRYLERHITKNISTSRVLKLNPNKCLFNFFWLYFATAINGAGVKFKNIPQFAQRILLVWLMAWFALKLFFADNMISLLARAPVELNIDSLDDLAREEHLQLWMTLTRGETEDEPYFDTESDYGKNLNSRLNGLGGNVLLNESFLVTMAEEIVSFKSAGVAAFDTLNWVMTFLGNGSYRDRMHVSKYGAEVQPTFLPILFPASKKMVEAVNKMAKRLLHGGITHKWAESNEFGYMPRERSEGNTADEGKFLVAEFSFFVPVFKLFLYFNLFCFFILLIEIFSWFYHSVYQGQI